MKLMVLKNGLRGELHGMASIHSITWRSLLA